MNTERLSTVGKPKFWLENSEKDAPEYKQEYGSFAYSVIEELRSKESDFPKDVVIVGANWTLIVEGSDRPKVDCIIWHIENRFVPQIANIGSIGKIDDILEEIQDGVDGYKFASRMGEKIAILDVAGAGYSIIDDGETDTLETREWGQIVRHPFYPTKIYHITHGYKTKGKKELPPPEAFIDGRPSSWLSTLESEAVSSKIALFSLATINELRLEESDIPLEVLTVGDNWKQLFLGRIKPNNAQEEEKLEKHPTLIFGELWRAEARERQEDFPKLYSKLFMKVVMEEITEDKILARLTILDRTSRSCPIFMEDEIDVLEKRSWGRIIKPKGYNVIVYHIIEDPNTKYYGQLI